MGKPKKKQDSIVRLVIRINILAIIVVGVILSIVSGALIYKRVNTDYATIADTASSHVVSWLDVLDEGDYSFDEATGKLYKGKTEITDQAFWTIHNDNEDFQHTIFWGDTRVLSDIRNDDGSSVVGTKLNNDKIYNEVKSTGKYVENNVSLFGKRYSVCYYAIKNGNQMVGMVFTGVNQTAANVAINYSFLILIIIMLVFTGTTAFSTIKLVNQKSKEFGGNLNQASGIANDKRNSVVALSARTNSNMEQINLAIDEVAQAVTAQASHTEEIMGSMTEFGTSIDNIMARVSSTSEVASQSIGLMDMLNKQLVELENVSEENSKEIDVISGQIEEDNQAVSEIKKIIDVINDIAFQITILSFNASVEAARAGEYGKGFAVVADSIKDLSDKTQNSLNEISAIIQDIDEKMIATSRSSQDLMKQNDMVVTALAQTKERLVEVTAAFQEITENIGEVMQESTAIIDSKNQVVETVSSLAAASEENAAMSEQIRATSDEVINSTQELVDEVEKLQEITTIIEEVKILFNDKMKE